MARCAQDFRGVVVGGIIVAMAAGCAGAPSAPTHGDVYEKPSADLDAQELGPGIWDVATGERLDEEALMERLSVARFVIAAESHDDPWHHVVQDRIYRGVSQRAEGPVALGVEMVEARFQPALDAYIAAAIDEARMLEGVEWEARWGMDWAMYAPMWRAARELGQPVVALNAPRELVRAVGRAGIEGLSDEERDALPELDLNDPSYRAWLASIFAAHGMGEDEEALSRFFEAQVLWDETMAENAVRALTDDPELAAMVLLVGRGHAERGFGIEPRILRRLAGSESAKAEARVVVVVPVSVDGQFGERMRDYRSLNYLQENNIADFVWIEAGDADVAQGSDESGRRGD